MLQYYPASDCSGSPSASESVVNDLTRCTQSPGFNSNGAPIYASWSVSSSTVIGSVFLDSTCRAPATNRFPNGFFGLYCNQCNAYNTLEGLQFIDYGEREDKGWGSVMVQGCGASTVPAPSRPVLQPAQSPTQAVSYIYTTSATFSPCRPGQTQTCREVQCVALDAATNAARIAGMNECAGLSAQVPAIMPV